jgi:hypothetical protein
MRTSNQFKNIFKRLRNNGPASLLPINKRNKTKQRNYYDCLDFEINETNETNETNDTNKQCVSKKGLNLSCLPEEMIHIILEYLPIDTRIKILKNKYNEKIIQLKLENIPTTDIKKLFEYASIAEEVLKFALKKESNVFEQFSISATEWFKEEIELHKYLRFYKENFTKMILAAMKYYTKIYKKIICPTKLLYSYTIGNETFSVYKTSRKQQYNRKIKVIEEMIFRLYAKLILIK